jgi:Tol biopolymer transport system component
MAEATPTIYRQRADGTGRAEKLVEPVVGEPLFAFSLAGNRLVVGITPGGPGNADLMTLDVSHSAGSTATPLPKLQPLVTGPAGQINGTVSPDGRWLAYQSNESGVWEVYVQPYGAGATGLRATVSNTGGVQPRWSADGRELFYVTERNEMMVVKVRPGTIFVTSVPEQLFDAGKYFFGLSGAAAGNPFFNYDVARSGRFLMLKSTSAEQAGIPTPDSIMIVQHWTEELKRISGR